MSDLHDEIMRDGYWQPGGTSKHRSKRKDLEASVQRECLAWLTACDNVLYVERRNSGAVQFSDGAFMRFGAKGAADIWCIVKGVHGHYPVHIEIECKRRDGKGRLSQHQKVFQKHCEEIGVPYLVVTSAEDLEQQLKEKGLV